MESFNTKLSGKVNIIYLPNIEDEKSKGQGLFELLNITDLLDG